MYNFFNFIKNQFIKRYKLFKKKVKKKSFIYVIFILLIELLILLLIKKSIFALKKKRIPFIKNDSKLKFTYKINKKKLNFNKTEVIDDYLAPILPKYNKYKKIERIRIEYFLSMKTLPKNKNDTINEELKQELLNKINKIFHKRFTNIDTVYITKPIMFGNSFIMINDILFCCEILGCKNIYFDPKMNLFIKNKIVTDKYNISLNSEINCSVPTTLCTSLKYNIFWFSSLGIRQEIRIDILKNEIRRNLPQLKIDEDDLYIHIRVNNHVNYAQPPLCFYETIINNFNFKNIYIISGIKNSPIIDKIVSKYPKIIFKMNNREVDISYLANAYNLIGSQSSFFEVSVKFNDNLKIIFEYNILKNSEKIFWLHHDFFYFKRKYTIFQMQPSIDYRNKMFVWKMEPKQDQYMIEEKCSSNFHIIKPNIN